MLLTFLSGKLVSLWDPPSFDKWALLSFLTPEISLGNIEGEESVAAMGKKKHSSYGIACFRCGPSGEIEIMLINKRYTYAFCDFVYGRYNAANEASVLSLIEHMTANEKILLLLGNFDVLWFLIWLDSKNGPYASARAYFQGAFGGDSGREKLGKLVRRAQSHGQCRWEIPKGRLNTGETTLECAQREFSEETGVGRDSYKMVPNFIKKHLHKDASGIYHSTFYLALARPWTSPALTPPYEVGEAKWASLSMINHISKSLWHEVKPIFNYVKQHYSSEMFGRSSRL
jgi:8-oxo-dGTP pyrophosphatase MutT (NUDIX family)